MNRRIIKHLCFVAAACALATTFVATRPVSAAGACTDASRACAISSAQTYLDALLSHDATHVRLAPNVVRYENGILSANGAADMRHQLETFPLYKVITAINVDQWVVEGARAVAFYRIEANLIPGVPQHAATAHVAEMFTLRNGLITRIQVVDCFAGALRPESGVGQSRAPLLTDLCVRTGPRSV